MNRYPQIHPRLIGFDIDCVVADTMAAFIRIAKSDYNIDVKPHQITSFQVEQCLTINPLVIAEIFERLLRAPIENDLRPMPYAVDVLTSLATSAPLTFITARPQQEPIADWLQAILPLSVYESSRLVAMGNHDGKADYVKKLGLEYFIDDRLDTCEELAAQGLFPVVFSQPWNRIIHKLAHVESWLDIEKGILKK